MEDRERGSKDESGDVPLTKGHVQVPLRPKADAETAPKVDKPPKADVPAEPEKEEG